MMMMLLRLLCAGSSHRASGMLMVTMGVTMPSYLMHDWEMPFLLM
jgi:hypothetical protein